MEAFREVCSFLLRRASPGTSGTPIRLCRDFLLALSSPPASRQGTEARQRIRDLAGDPGWADPADFLLRGLSILPREIESTGQAPAHFNEEITALASRLRASADSTDPDAHGLVESFWQVFCSQAAGVRGAWDEKVRQLRARRTIHDLTLCQTPIRDPAKEILFTANALLTVPPRDTDAATLGLTRELHRGVARAMAEEQAYWYDHPVPIGTPAPRNEILYGLKGLSDALRFEKRRGNAGPHDTLDVILSVSVTHPGLQVLARDYIEGEIQKEPGIRDLDIYVFTEHDTTRLVEEFLYPAARHFGINAGDPLVLARIIGVDGPYARHYNFLKAVAALWQVTKAPHVQATFKIDLDQVFPQEQLVQEAGGSAFDLLRSPLWGARGRDPEGRPVCLGMIAGALVNERDIQNGLFTPDVTLPEGPWSLDEWIFASRVPQALSTEAEMMARYGQGELDGLSRCLTRIHVTGGTVGIRLDSLTRYRPFTLSYIGRAEDQAFLLSVLFGPVSPCLRYAHLPGLIMRHDKEAFAGEAIRAAAAGKLVGDYERMLLFSEYARALPWPLDQVRSCLNPFTGCFVLDRPLTTVWLCLALKILSLDPDRGIDPGEVLRVAARRIGALLARSESTPGWMKDAYLAEATAWNAYYDILEKVRVGLASGSTEARSLAGKARAVIEATRVGTT